MRHQVNLNLSEQALASKFAIAHINYDRHADVYPGFACYLDGTGLPISPSDIFSKPRGTTVHVLFCFPATDATFPWPTYNVSHVGIVSAASAPYEAGASDWRVTVDFVGMSAIGRGPVPESEARYATTRWSAKVFDPVLHLPYLSVLRPSFYDFVNADLEIVTMSAYSQSRWRYTSEMAPAENSPIFCELVNDPSIDPLGSKIVAAASHTGTLSIAAYDPMSLSSVVKIASSSATTYSNADMRSPIAVAKDGDVMRLQWLAWQARSKSGPLSPIIYPQGRTVPAETLSAASSLSVGVYSSDAMASLFISMPGDAECPLDAVVGALVSLPKDAECPENNVPE